MGSSLFFNNYKTSAVQRVNNGILIDIILCALRFYNLWASTFICTYKYVLCFNETGKISIRCSKMPIYRRPGSPKDQLHIGQILGIFFSQRDSFQQFHLNQKVLKRVIPLLTDYRLIQSWYSNFVKVKKDTYLYSQMSNINYIKFYITPKNKP